MARQSFAQWREPGASNLGPSALGPQPVFRDAMDAARTAGRTPNAQYPDGYLGTITSRRMDRLYNPALTVRRQNEVGYQRGVHKGERIDPSDYLWPPEFGPMSGLMAEAAGVKFVPPGLLTQPTHLVNDGRPAVAASSPERAARLSALRPPWK